MSEELAGLLDRAWTLLEHGAAHGAAATRTLTLATVGTAGGAEARMVALRRADRRAGRLEIHVDAASGKIAEIAAEPRGTLLAWDPGENVQLRLRSRLRVGTGPDIADRWEATPEGARFHYGGTPTPGTSIPARTAYRDGAEFERMAVIWADIAEIEVLDLEASPHGRATFAAADGFKGRWIAP